MILRTTMFFTGHCGVVPQPALGHKTKLTSGFMPLWLTSDGSHSNERINSYACASFGAAWSGASERSERSDVPRRNRESARGLAVGGLVGWSLDEASRPTGC